MKKRMTEKLASTVGISLMDWFQLSLAVQGCSPMPNTSSKLGQGAFRKTFSLGSNYVVKFSGRGLAGRVSSLLEAYSYEKATKNKLHFAKFLCKVIAVHPQGKWIIMERAEEVGKCREDMRQKWGKWLCDLHDGNIGKVNGEWKCIDYGQVPDFEGDGCPQLVWNATDWEPPQDFKEMFPNWKH